MGATKIEWCDFTFNCWRGCTKVSDGCKHCYAEAMSGRNRKTLGMWGPNGTRVVAAEAMWREPLKWNKEAEYDQCPSCGTGGHISEAPEEYLRGEPVECQGRDSDGAPCGALLKYERPRVFCASLADVFEDWQGPMVTAKDGYSLFTDPHEGWGGWVELPSDFVWQKTPFRPTQMADVRARLFRLIDATPNLDWLLLTKRPENIARMMPKYAREETRPIFPGAPGKLGEPMRCIVEGGIHPNVWIGTSVENQQAADERIPHLLKVPAAVRFLSVEPMLGPVDLSHWLGIYKPERAGSDIPWTKCVARPINQIHWVICGGESGPGARPMHPDWARSLRDQCQAAGVPFFYKQWGEWCPSRSEARSLPASCDLDGQEMWRIGKKAAGRMLDGLQWSEFPQSTKSSTGELQ